MTELVLHIVKLCVHEPEAVSVEESDDRGSKVYLVTVSPNDTGRLIGKDGRVISCIRQIVAAIASKSRVRAFVKVKAD